MMLRVRSIGYSPFFPQKLQWIGKVASDCRTNSICTVTRIGTDVAPPPFQKYVSAAERPSRASRQPAGAVGSRAGLALLPSRPSWPVGSDQQMDSRGSGPTGWEPCL